MPRITVLENMYSDEVSETYPDGGRMLDLLDQMAAPVQFSCTDGRCGMCRCEVQDGSPLFDPKEEKEARRLEELRAPENHRLMCQTRLRPGDGQVTLRWAGAD